MPEPSLKSEFLPVHQQNPTILFPGTRGTFRAAGAGHADDGIPKKADAGRWPPEMQHLVQGMVAEAMRQLHRRTSNEQRQFGGAAIPLDGMAGDLGERLLEMLTLTMALEWPEEFLTEERLRHTAALLGPLLRATVADWVSATATLLHRLQRDKTRLAQWLGSTAPAVVTTLEAAASDAHPGGHSVVRIAFASGECVYYKPRPLTGEWLWEHLLAAVAAQVPGLPLPAASVLMGESHTGNVGGYGWMRSLRTEDKNAAGSTVNAAAYWRTAGAMLCLARQVSLSDLHMGNVLATPLGPAVMDAECFGAPPMDRTPNRDAQMAGGPVQATVASLLNTGLLSRHGRSEPSHAWPDVSGFFGHAAAAPGVHVPLWAERGGRHLLTIAPAVLMDQRNGAASASLLAVLPHMLEGYRAAASGLIAARNALLRSESEWRRVLETCHASRVVVRQTFSYARLISASMRPEVLGSTERRRREFLQGLDADGLALPKALVRAEVRAMLGSHLPRFVLLPGTRTLATGSGRKLARNFVKRSASETVVDRIAALTEQHVNEVGIPALMAIALRQ